MVFRILCLSIIVNLFWSCDGHSQIVNGVSFVAAPDSISVKHVKPVVDIHANFAAVMPFGFVKSLGHPDIIYNTERQWFGETVAGTAQYIKQLKTHNIQIMIKPQIWVWRGEFTGKIEMLSESDWQSFETAYSKFILEHAQLAEDTNAEMFCIGTELETFVANRPQYWEKLIERIRAIYKGKLTYAANWDEYKRTPFWKDLDYIGVDAYFPVSDLKTPSVEECKLGWQKHKMVLEDISKTFNKKILFTEFGYRSVDYAGKEPWRSDRSMTAVNFEAQNNTTQALFEEFWHESDWFAGGFIWKWFHNYERSGGEGDSQFTPQNKPSEEIVKRFFKANQQ